MTDDKIVDSNDQGTEKKPMVLIVDDVPKNLQVLASTLRAEDCQIAAATNGQKALDMLNKITPDLILLDVMMPELNGFQVCEKLKADPNTAELPIIFLTARTETEDIVKGFRLGAVDYVTKPFNPAELLARVRTQLELKKARDSEKTLISELRTTLADLKDALARVKALSGLLPICSNCKKIRDDKGYWQQVENYLEDHSEAQFSHSLCPNCVRKLYPKVADKMLKEL
ncbi:MAG: response regulator [bacterium]|nr:response regulator [bacterium]